MPTYTNTKEPREKFARIQKLADEIAKALDQAGGPERQGSYLDSRCEEIKTLCVEISGLVGLGTGIG